MEPQPPNLLNRFYLFFNKLIIALNTFASLQRYVIIKKRTKTSKKGVFRKTILMCDRGKEYMNKSGGK